MCIRDREWVKLKRSVNRLSIRDLCAAIVPALHDQPGRVLIAVDDFTAVTPTLVAFWLAVFEAAQVIGCASAKRPNVAKLWWKMAEMDVPPLAIESARAIAQTYLRQTGTLVESPPLFIAHLVPVSYTHLDVYKRQVYRRRALWRYRPAGRPGPADCRWPAGPDGR